eukprot:15110-Heterococcus_DN1.PRE.2
MYNTFALGLLDVTLLRGGGVGLSSGRIIVQLRVERGCYDLNGAQSLTNLGDDAENRYFKTVSNVKLHKKKMCLITCMRSAQLPAVHICKKRAKPRLRLSTVAAA